MEILVIGPEPPCIRCMTTYKYAKQIAEQFPDKVTAKKIFAGSKESEKYGNVAGGHDIAEKERIDHDSDGIMGIMKEIDALIGDEDKNEGIILEKMEQIQEKLVPITQKAVQAGYLMTPVLVINEKIKSVGVVPNKQKMLEWVKAELGQ
jgi:hypothetical protein